MKLCRGADRTQKKYFEKKSSALVKLDGKDCHKGFVEKVALVYRSHGQKTLLNRLVEKRERPIPPFLLAIFTN